MRPTKTSKKLPFEPFFYRLFTIYLGLQTKRIINPFTNVSKRLKMKTVGALGLPLCSRPATRALSHHTAALDRHLGRMLVRPVSLYAPDLEV
jgi:hypothetical protein